MHQEPTPADRIVLTTSAVMSGVALSGLALLPSWERELQVLGSPLGLGQLLSGYWLVVTLLVLLTAAGMDGLVRSIPELRDTPMRYTFTTWVLPCLVTVAAASVVPDMAGDPRAWVLSVAFFSLLLLVVVSAGYGTLLESAPWHRAARLALTTATYFAALALYYRIYDMQVRSLMSATAVLLVTFPLALELLRDTAEDVAQTWLYAAVVALVISELTWVLNAWGLSALQGGALLLVLFYVFGGISQQHMARRLTRRVALEFTVVGLVGFAAVWLSSGWL